MTSEERIKIGVASRILGPTVTGAVLGIHATRASNLSTGLRSARDAHGESFKTLDQEERTEIAARVNEKKGKIIDTTLDRLLDSVNLLGPDNLGKKKGSILAGVAAKLAGVVERVEGRTERQTGQNFQLVVFAPQIRSESQFKVIDVES